MNHRHKEALAATRAGEHDGNAAGGAMSFLSIHPQIRSCQDPASVARTLRGLAAQLWQLAGEIDGQKEAAYD